MNRRGRWLLSIGVIVTLAVAVILWRHHSFTHAEHQTSSTRAPMSERSLYQLESAWRTDADRSLRLRELRGHYQIVVLMFTECVGICPILVKQLQHLQTTLPPAIDASTRFVAISIDPDRDTPQVLSHYRQQMHLDSRWTLLTGDSIAVREVTAVLGFNYAPGPADQFVHSSLVSVLDPAGSVIHQQPGAADMQDIVRIIAADKERRADLSHASSLRHAAW
ncbi:MAG TPA: SCO family protein [Povalibacter sp.]|nr:SCO family protein [Povalibacter sp.]